MTGLLEDPRTTLDRRDVRPVVRLPRAGLSGAAIALICGALGVMLFLVLDSNRRAMAAPPAGRTQMSSIVSPPPLAVPLATPAAPPLSANPALAAVEVATSRPVRPDPRSAPAPIPPAYYPPPPPIPMAAPQLPAAGSASEKLIVLDLGRGEAPALQPGGEGGKGDAVASDDQAVRATIIRGRSSLVPQGTLIPAVLETPIDSTRAGLVRALVSRDVKGFDGTRVLIPRGSRLLGEAKGDAQAGQRRVLVTWARLIRPDGVAIRIGSPGADNLGGAGLRGSVNTHFAERFANAVLQSALTIGVNLASRPRDGSVFVGLPGQLGGTVGQMPLFNVPTGPTIKVAKGAEIAVFVARDLDFGGVAPVR